MLNNTILALLDRDEFPEAYHYLENDLDNTPFEIATMLMESDRPKPFPKFLVTYILELYEAEIEKGNINAMNDLGACYYNGDRGFDQDFSLAVHYYTMAAEHSDIHSRENLGYCYYYGRNMEVDYEKAFHCFAPGAFSGRPASLYKIGDMYLNGYFVRKNVRDAFRIYRHCLDLLDDDSSRYVAGPVHLRLGNMYLKGIGTDRDPERALQHFHAAEYFLYKMVKYGDVMYKKSLREAIEGQAIARAAMADNLPDNEWTFADY